MIVSRAPVRFSLGGGGTDLPSYSREHGGFLVAAAIDKYVIVCAAKRFYDTIRLAYSKTETVERVDQVEHRIFREALRLTKIQKGIELREKGDAQTQEGHAEKRPQRQEGQEPQAGNRHRAFGSASRRRKSAAPAHEQKQEQKQERVAPMRKTGTRPCAGNVPGTTPVP